MVTHDKVNGKRVDRVDGFTVLPTVLLFYSGSSFLLVYGFSSSGAVWDPANWKTVGDEGLGDDTASHMLVLLTTQAPSPETPSTALSAKPFAASVQPSDEEVSARQVVEAHGHLHRSAWN